jgi:hypothetical protein
MQKPIEDEISDRRDFCSEVIRGAQRKVNSIVNTSCDALNYTSTEGRHHLLDRVNGAMQAYAFYRTAIVPIPEKDVKDKFKAIDQGINADLATVIRQRVELAVDDTIEELLKKKREGGRGA